MIYRLPAIAIAIAIALVLAGLCLPASAAPRDLPGVGTLRWTMSTQEVLAALPAGAERLDPPWDFGRMKAPARVPETEVSGLTFTAMLQIEAASDRLLQVMLERREQQATPADFEQLRANLERDYGPPTRICETRRPSGDSESVNLVWRFPTTTVDLSYLDYRTTGILYQKSELVPDPMVPSLQKRQVSRRSLPRRLVLRFHDTAADYLSPCLTRAEKPS
jgi:hypothetical protein